MLLVLGDLNAQTGSNNRGNERSEAKRDLHVCINVDPLHEEEKGLISSIKAKEN